MIKIGIVTVSDRAYSGQYENKGGPAIKTWLDTALQTQWEPVFYLVPDEQKKIEQALVNLVDNENCTLILTTGGTGPAPRDVTPDATKAVGEKEMPGFGERMRSISLQYVPTAILSRQTAVIRKKCLIVNLPGQPRSIKETLDQLFETIPYCVELVSGVLIETHPEVVKAFRPKQ